MTGRGTSRAGASLVCAFAGLLAWGPPALVRAQAPAELRAGLPEEFGRALERARRQVETLYVLRLSEKIALNTEQAAQVGTILRKAQDARRSLLDERRQLLQELNALLDTGAGPERIKVKLAQWEQNEARLGRWRQGLFQDLSRVLSVEQQGRYLVFDESFSAEIRNAILDLGAGKSARGND